MDLVTFIKNQALCFDYSETKENEKEETIVADETYNIIFCCPYYCVVLTNSIEPIPYNYLGIILCRHWIKTMFILFASPLESVKV